MSAVDVLIVLMLQSPTAANDSPQLAAGATMWLGLLACCVPACQLYIYHSDAPWAGEQTAHYVEFFFDAVSAAVSFWFCIDSMQLAERMKLEIMLAPSELSIVLHGSSRHAVHVQQEGDSARVSTSAE